MAHWLQERGCPSARRSQQYSGTDGTSDIKAEELPHIHIECKATTSPTIELAKLIGKTGWLPQVKRDCPKDCNWVILNKSNVHDPIALVALSHFKEIARGNIFPIAAVGESFAPVLELEKACQVLRTIRSFNTVMGYDFVMTVPVVVYETIPEHVIVAFAAERWIKWVLDWEKLK